MKVCKNGFATKLCVVGVLVIVGVKTVRAGSVILKSFAGIGQTGAVPPDMGGAVGANFIVQTVNGGVRITDKNGSVVQAQISDGQFWQNAGISSAITNPGLSDPRVIFDPGSQRFFVSEINVTQTANVGNRVLLAVSNSTDPTLGFKAVSFAGFGAGSSPLADFPTLGVDQNSIYVGTNNFADNTTFSGVSLFAIPKTSFVASQSLANITRFDNLNPDAVGFTLQGVSSTSATSKIFAIDNSILGDVDITGVIGAGSAGATLGSTVKLTGVQDGFPNKQRQPDGSRTLDGGDDRFGASVFQAGNYIFATNAIGDSTTSSASTTHDIVHWMIVNAVTNTLVVQGQISDPNFDYTYPSIAANANGDFLLAYNQSGPTGPNGFVSDYGDVCHFNAGTSAVSCESPLLLKSGVTNYTESHQRWGDYSAAQVDPIDPNVFWAFQEYSGSAASWATQITEIGPALVTPEPGTFGITAIPALVLWAGRRKRRKTGQA